MWCCGVRFALVLPRVLGRTAYPRPAFVVASERTSQTAAQSGRAMVRIAKAGEPGPVSLRSRSIPQIGLVPACPEGNPHAGPSGHAFDAPQCFAPGPFPALTAPGVPPVSGRTRPASAAPEGRRSGHFGTLLGATGGDPNTLAPNRKKARTTPLFPSRISASF